VSRIKRAKPSAALIVAVVALVAALCGGAVAGVTISKLKPNERNQVKRISKRQAKKLDKKIELLPGPQGEQGDRGEPATNLYALVKQDGTLLYGEGVSLIGKSNTGTYDVTFNRNVADCVPVATAGSYSSVAGDFQGNFAFSDAIASTIHNGNDTVTVRFFQATTEALSDTSFNLALFCP
jgi:hypothetical protein